MGSQDAGENQEQLEFEAALQKWLEFKQAEGG